MNITRKTLRLAQTTLALATLTLTFAFTERAAASYTALYGSDGEDFVGFTGNSSMSNMKNSGWNGLIMWALTVQPSGDITMNNGSVTLVTNGNYTGPSYWGSNVNTLKSQPTSVSRYEAALGGAGDKSFDNIKSLVASGGTGSNSILYRNFRALKSAVPGLDAINDDDEGTYDLNSSTSFGQMLGGLGYKVSLAPYTNQSFWVQLKANLGGTCDLVYLQCYEGGSGNDPGNWDNAFGGGYKVTPGIDSNAQGNAQADWSRWSSNYGITSGFFWPDTVWYPGASWGPQSITNALGNSIAGTHLIVNQQNGEAVDNASSAGSTTGPNSKNVGVILWANNGGNAQKWTFSQNSDTSWNIISAYNGQGLDDASSTANGAQIIQYPSNTANNNQRWWVDRQSDGTYKIWNKANSKSLDSGNKSGNNLPLIQWDWNGGSQQRWNLQ